MNALQPPGDRVPMDALDLEILGGLTALYDLVDPMPVLLPDVVLFGLEAVDLDAEVARLVASDLAGAGARSDEPVEHARRVTFSSDHLSVMLAVEPHGSATARVDGWAAPGAHLRVELRAGATTLSTTCDADGRFTLDDVPLGSIQVTLTPTAESDPDVTMPVVTPAIHL